MHVVLQLRVHVQVMAPLRDLVGAVGKAVDDGHKALLLKQNSADVAMQPAGQCARAAIDAKRPRP